MTSQGGTKSVAQRLLSGASWSLISSVLNRLTPLLVSLIVARQLGKDEFGQFGMVRNSVTMLAVFSGIALGMAVTKFVATAISESKDVSPIFVSAHLIAFVSGLFGAVGMWLLAEPIAVNLLNAPQLTELLKLSSSVLLFMVLAGSSQGVLAGMERYRELAIANFVLSAASIPLSYWLIVKFGIEGGVYAIVVHSFLSWFILFLLLMRYGFKIRVDEICSNTTKILKIALPLVLLEIILVPSFWYSRTLLVKSSGDFSSVAVIDAAYQWLSVIMIIAGSVVKVSLPILSSSREVDRKKTLALMLKVNMTICIGLTLIFIVFSRYIASIYGADFQGDQLVFCIIFAVSIPFALTALYKNYYISQGKTWVPLTAVIFQCVALIGFTKLYSNDLNEVIFSKVLLASWLIAVLVYLAIYFYRKKERIYE